MGNIWDLDTAPHPVHGRRKAKKTQRKAKKAPEQDMVSGTNDMVKTAGNFMTTAMGMTVMANLGSTAIAALAKK